MFYNYFKIAWRNLRKRSLYTLVTIVGLAVGITFTLLMTSYIHGELSVNDDLKNAENQVLVRSKWKNPDMGVDITTLGPLGETLKEAYPGLIANYYRYDAITVNVSKGDKHFREDVQTGDSTLLTMFGFPLLHGDARTALQMPNSLVITAEKALRYFGKTNVTGQTLTLHNFQGGKQEFQITGVLENLPDNSVTRLLTNPAHIFSPLSSLEGRKGAENDWDFPYMVTYLELQKDVSAKDLDKPLEQLLKTHTPGNISQNLRIYLTPLQEYYLEANNEVAKKMIWTLAGITFFIMLMAIVNYVNISIGNSSSRLKEIGVRKVLGSQKNQLIGQFLAESLLLSLFATLLSIGLYEICTPFFEGVLGKKMASVFTLFPWSLVVPMCLAALIGLLGGIYPAFVLSSIPSVDSMKGTLKSIQENVYLRRLLIGSQFGIALSVFAGAVIVGRQVDYFFNKDLGYQKESLVTVPVPRDWTPQGLTHMETIRRELSTLTEVNNASLSYEIPNGNTGNNSGIFKQGQDSLQAITAQILTTDDHYAGTYGIDMLAGDFFQKPDAAYQPDRIVLSEAAVKALGYSSAAEAIGQQVRIQGAPNARTVTGVTRNFHFESMHKVVKPLAFVHVRGGNVYRYLSFRIAPSNLGKSLAAIEQKWKILMPDAPFEFAFMDDTLQKLYTSEMQLKKAAQIATVLSVVIVLLGILGMVSLQVARRTREVGIRKVLGSSEAGIIMLFLKEFLLIFAFAALIAFPAAIVIMRKWLQTYAYRIDINPAIFATVGLIFLITITTLVCLQTYKTALMNPVKSLRGD